MDRLGRTSSRDMTAPDSLTALAIAAETDIMALCPIRMARQFQQAFSLVILKAPYESRPIEVNALWRKDNAAHPAIGWLKDLLIAESAAI